jgi:uncharacterized repeat protein (TIGR02543 family)
VTKDPEQTSYNSGSSVTLIATPAAGYQFSGWSGAATDTTNPLTVFMNSNKTITATFAPLPQTNDLVSNISASSSRSYVLSELVVGTALYTDRTHLVTAVPTFLNRAPFIRTPNDDKGNKTTSVLSFQLSQSAMVYVAYDPRATKLPAWLSDWQKLSDRLGVNDPNISFLNLYSKTYAAGTVILGGNLASPATGALSNYIVLIKAVPEISATALRLSQAGSVAGKGENKEQSLQLEVFPNPAQPNKNINVMVENFGCQEKVTVTLQDMVGRVIASKTVVTDDRGVAKAEIGVNNKSAGHGIYIIRAQGPSGNIQKKVLIE